MTRIEKIQKSLSEHDLDAILLINPKNRRYATGFPSSDGTVLVTRREVFCFVDSRYIEAARNSVKNATIGLTCRDMPLKAWLRRAISDCCISRLGFEEEYMPYGEYTRFCEMLPIMFIPASKIITQLRASKDESELASMKRAQSITEAAFSEILDFIRPGVSEREIAAEITYRQLKHGAEGNSFDPIVVTGKKSSMPHGVPSDDIVSEGDFVTMDFGCLKDGYCSDMTRTVAVSFATDEMAYIYETVLSAQKAGISAARSGRTGKVIDKAARDVIEKAGFGEYFGHSFGHSLGLDIHEFPSAAPSEEHIMPPGAVISAEPGIYLPGKFGVRIEDVLFLRPDGCENLTNAEKKLIIL